MKCFVIVILGLVPCDAFLRDAPPCSMKVSNYASAVHVAAAEPSTCQVLEELIPIKIPGQEKDASFLGAMAVPTFASLSGSVTVPRAHEQNPPRARGLEGVLCQGPAFVLDHVLSRETCNDIIQTCEAKVGFGSFRAGKNYHGALQILVSPDVCHQISQALAPHVDLDQVAYNMQQTETTTKDEDVRFVYAGLNRRWRIYRYEPGGQETFAPHIDAGFPPSGLDEDQKTLLWDASGDEQVVSRLTVLLYLNDDFVGGETNFYAPLAEHSQPSPLLASVRPRAGSVLVFPQAVGEEAVDWARQHWPLHEGSPVSSGERPKYVIRSDVLFAVQREPLPLEDKLFQHDHLVRGAFLPRSSVHSAEFLHHVSSLYNPHMGVEHFGPFLYSFLRLTKRRRIVEIGAGYTSLWILQALKDNDDELKRIRELQDQEKCRLLDYEWTISDIVDNLGETPASLLCVDNCLHQKETATGATAIAKSLGLENYFDFLQGDAFDLDLEEESVDVLWCDFGVGARMTEFVSKAWGAVRPGGFLLCHSTLTNTRTREWLEAVRARKGQDETGMPPDQYTEVSLLEPHKRYQNSISILQKRKGTEGKSYEEPLYSEYA